MSDLANQLAQAYDILEQHWTGQPRIGIILGTGLGHFAEEIQSAVKIPYHLIPHFPTSTVESHTGQLVCGDLSGVTVVAMEGRFHFYEGYNMQQITFPVRLMKRMGCNTLIVSNACGGLNPHYHEGDLMVIEDHINLLGANPLIGPNDETLGPRFPDMSEPYDRRLIARAKRVALEKQIILHEGVYVAVAGPNLETRAEYRFLRQIGADVVGMSTIPEVLVARHANMQVLGLSVITDMCLPDALRPVELEKIIQVANEAEPKLRTIVREVVATLAAENTN